MLLISGGSSGRGKLYLKISAADYCPLIIICSFTKHYKQVWCPNKGLKGSSGAGIAKTRFRPYSDQGEREKAEGGDHDIIKAPTLMAAEPMWRNGRAYDSGPKIRGFVTRLGQLVFPSDEETNRHS